METTRGLQRPVVKAFQVSPLMSNCYVMSESDSRGAAAVIIDPGDTNLDPVFQHIDEHGLNVEAVWLTHAHFDHALGIDVARDRLGVPVFLHEADLSLLEAVPTQVRTWLGQEVPDLRGPDKLLQDGDILQLGPFEFEVWHTPGHAPGEICLVGDTIVLTGDTVFRGSIGRVDFPESSPEAMRKSLERILSWSDERVLYPGHMGSTTMAEERASIQFFIQQLS